MKTQGLTLSLLPPPVTLYPKMQESSPFIFFSTFFFCWTQSSLLSPQFSLKIFLFLYFLLSHWWEGGSSPNQTRDPAPAPAPLLSAVQLDCFNSPQKFFWLTIFPFLTRNDSAFLVFADHPQVLLKAQEFSFRVHKGSLAHGCPQRQLQSPLHPWLTACSAPFWEHRYVLQEHRNISCLVNTKVFAGFSF